MTKLHSIAAAALLAAAGCGHEPAAEPRAAGPEQPEGHRRMIALLDEIDRRTDEDNVFFGDRKARELRERVRAAGEHPAWRDVLDLGMAELHLGHEREAIARLEQARTLVGEAGDPAGMLEATFNLGVAHLRLAETENCCARRTGESCILPIRGGGLHGREQGSRAAIPYFLEVLEKMPPDDYWHRASRWLLNLAYMTIGAWPAEVPERWRMPERAFRSAIDFPRFRNISGEIGLDAINLAGGAIADDFDNDDDLDLVVSTWDTRGQTRFFRHEADGSFVDATAEAGLTGLRGGLYIVQADYDNDGWLDFLVVRGAWLGQAGRHPDSLVRNNGDGTFTDMTFAAGLGEVHYPSQAAAWADYDLDGDLDLYMGSEAAKNAPYPGQLFRNDGTGHFTDVAEEAGVRNLRFAKGVVWGDYDDDGDPDLFVSNQAPGQEDRLYRNDGDGTFTDVAASAGLAGPWLSFPAWFWDYDNDGALDLYVAAYATGVGHIVDHYLDGPPPPEIGALYHNDGTGFFTDVAREVGLDYPALTMGSNFGDLDGDGWLDFYLGTGNPYLFELMPNLMYLNRGGRSFLDVTMAGGFGHLQKGHGISFADLDQDGDMDVFAVLGGAFPVDRFANALFENPGFGNRFVSLDLVGTRSPRCAIGARIRIEVRDAEGTRTIYRHVTSGSSFGANPLRQTIGLGRAESIRSVEIRWPATGLTQAVGGVELDSAIEVTEGSEGFRRLGYPRLPFLRTAG